MSDAEPGAVVLKLPTYVLVTPARNEAQFIESTILSVVAQTVRPLRWVIVSDGSTDGTDEIVSRYAAKHEWIELLRMPERKERNFAGKAYAFSAGKARLEGVTYDVIANLDADITFEQDYFSYLLVKLAVDPSLGVVGTPYVETTGESFDYRFTSRDHVSGACQVFRRECYEAIGGYAPVKVGTIDCIAVITARMKGWKTRTFTDKVCHHHRKVGTAQCGPMKANFTAGAMDYAMGNHPLWELFRSAYQTTRKPYLIRGVALGMGYMWSYMRGVKRPVSHEIMIFHRREQMQRLKNKVTGKRVSADNCGVMHSNSSEAR
ncbi:MAG: glycosyltransferase family 2 protein [Acidobacteriaceae bacterium]|nr:glycosyltransferase family 2 protein [Acidobacteriaceae bacterium]